MLSVQRETFISTYQIHLLPGPSLQLCPLPARHPLLSLSLLFRFLLSECSVTSFLLLTTLKILDCLSVHLPLQVAIHRLPRQSCLSFVDQLELVNDLEGFIQFAERVDQAFFQRIKGLVPC